LLTLAAAQKIDKGEQARVEIAAIKVVGAVRHEPMHACGWMPSAPLT